MRSSTPRAGSWTRSGWCFGPRKPEPKPRLPMETKSGTRGVRLADLAGDDGAEARVDEPALAFAVAGVQVVLGPRVGPFRRAHAADDDAVVHQLGDLRQVLADLDAGADVSIGLNSPAALACRA